MKGQSTALKRFCGERETRFSGFRGLTLIEFLLALALFGTVLTLLTSTLRGGLEVWGRGQGGQTGLAHELDLFSRKLGEEFENMIPFKPMPFRGESDEMSFTTAVMQFSEKGSQKRLAKVRYWLEGHELMREEKELGRLLQEERVFEGESSNEPWMEDVQSVSFEYAYAAGKAGIKWLSHWEPDENETAWPSGIRMNITMAGAEKQTLTAERIFFLPDGVRKEYHG